MKFGGLKGALPKAAPTPPKPSMLLPMTRSTHQMLRIQAGANEAEMNQAHKLVEEVKIPPATRPFLFGKKKEPESPLTVDPSDFAPHSGDTESENRKLSRLIEDDFPFDPSQLHAVTELVLNKYGCLTGAAGTGKTTTTKKLVDMLLESVTTEVDLNTYFKKNGEDEDVQDDDDYEVVRRFVPSVVMATFTGKASQMIKKNFPRDWHGNIMTIHRMLAFHPEYFEDLGEGGVMVNKRRFVPGYDKDFKLPWNIIILDEAGMISVDLWMQIYAAMTQGCRVYMIGDINQLPPVHGRSIFGFAMGNWPAFELTTIHRQAGKNNSIVDNAWRILQGKTAVFDSPKELSWMTPRDTVTSLNWMVQNKDWKSAGFHIPDDPREASKRIRQALKLLQGPFYDPIRDTVITAINGRDGSTSRQLGQIPMNQELAIMLNTTGQRYIIDAGRVRQNFAVGDKVMATKNDHEAGITNGMTGIVQEIDWNPQYTGDKNRWGEVEKVNEWMQNGDDVPGAEEDDFTLDSIEDLSAQFAEKVKGRDAGKEKKERGPASHIVTVLFGEGEHGFEIPFATLSEVESLSMAYVVTCHKMQGGESPHVFTILHTAHKGLALITREWLYTAWTRASEKSVLLYTPFALRTALNRQKITGTTLKEKIKSFQKIQQSKVTMAEDKLLPTAERIAA